MGGYRCTERWRRRSWPSRSLLCFQAYPDAAEQADKYGKLALHYGMEKPARTGSIMAMLQAYPDAATQADGRMMISQAPPAAIAAVLQTYPDVV